MICGQERATELCRLGKEVAAAWDLVSTNYPISRFAYDARSREHKAPNEYK